jgi:hypothetical protein
MESVGKERTYTEFERDMRSNGVPIYLIRVKN